jgi:hypothetical protein
MAIVSVYAIVKVMRLNKTVYDNGIWASQEFENLKKDLDNRIGNTYRDMDSRLDKLYSKIIKEVIPNKTFLQTISNYKPPVDDGDPVEYDQLKAAKRIMDKLDNNNK